MKLESSLDLLFSVLIIASAIPAFAVWSSSNQPKVQRWQPVSLVIGSFLLQLAFVNLITFGPLTLDYSIRFAAAGIPLSLAALILARRRNLSSTTALTVGCVLSLIMWFLFITLH